MSRASKVSRIDGSERAGADNHEVHFQIPIYPFPPSSNLVQSKHLEHLVDRPARFAPARGHGDDSVEPVVFFRSGFKYRRRTEIVGRRIDRFAGIQARYHVLRSMPQAAI